MPIQEENTAIATLVHLGTKAAAEGGHAGECCVCYCVEFSAEEPARCPPGCKSGHNDAFP